MCVQVEDKLIYEGVNMAIVDPPDIPFHNIEFIWPESYDRTIYDRPIPGNGPAFPSEDFFVQPTTRSEASYGRYKILKYEKWPISENGEVGQYYLFSSTACYRGHIGIWKIELNKLYLIGREDHSGIIQHEPIFARWYNGTLKVPKNNEFFDLFPVAKIYKKILEVNIEHGSVVSQKIVDNSQKPIFKEHDV